MNSSLLEHDPIDQWKSFVESHPDRTVFHAPEYYKILKRVYGLEYFTFGIWKQTELKGTLTLVKCPMLFLGQQLVALPFAGGSQGFLGYEECCLSFLVETITTYARGLGIRQIEMRESFPLGGAVNIYSEFSTFSLQLEGGPENTWNRKLNDKVRNQIRKAQKSNLEVRSGGIDLLPEFYEVYRKNMHFLGSPAHDLKFFRELMTHFPECSVMLTFFQNRPIAGLFLVRRGHAMMNPWAGSVKEFRALCANNLMYWQAIIKAQKLGCTTFEFGRSLRDSTQAKFKKQWGCDEIKIFHGVINIQRRRPKQLNPKAPSVRLLTEIWSRLPYLATDALGSFMIRFVP